LSEPERDLVSSEELNKTVDELLALVEERAERIRRAQQDRPVSRRGRSPVRAESPRKPQLDDLIRADLRRALEDEVVLAPFAVPGAEAIEPREFEREIMKRALVKLKLEDLKEVAAKAGVEWSGTEEELADRIVRAYGFNEEEIARLVLEHEDEPRPERGISERIYPIHAGSTAASSAVQALEALVGRYVRVGIARWFVFERVRDSAKGVVVDGVFRAYRAEPTERDEYFYIAPVEFSARVRVELHLREGLARIRARGTTESNAALSAIHRALDIVRIPSLPLGFDLPPDLMGWDRRTIYMLDVLLHRLNEEPLRSANLTMAHFEADSPGGDEDESRPRIRSVRLEGSHVTDSPQACQLLMAGRALVGVSLRVEYRPDRDAYYSFPIRISLGNDHVSALTGFGTERHALAGEVHGLLIERLEKGFRSLANPAGLVRTAAKIAQRAQERGTVERANIFTSERREPDQADDEPD
jgi:hypothetical protein